MSQVSRAVLLALAWGLVAALSRAMAHGATETMPVWLASGITFSALLCTPRWAWPAWLAGAGVAALAWGMGVHGLGPAPAFAFAGIEVVSMALGAWLATLGRQPAASPRGAALLIAGAVLAALLGATLAVALWSALRPAADLPFEWRTWALSTLVGLLLVAPLGVAFQGFRVRRSGGLGMAPFLGGAVAFLAFLLTAVLVFAGEPTGRWREVAATLAYVPMPFLLMAALLWGPRGGALAALAGSLLIVWCTSQGGGPFAVHEGVPGEAVVEVQGFILAWAVVLLLAQALAEGRRSALAQARGWQLRYERTLQAVGVAGVEYDAGTGQATWGTGAAEVLGIDAAAVTTHADWLARVSPAERGFVQAAWQAVATGARPSAEVDYALDAAGGRSRRVHERLAAVLGGDGRVEQVVALIQPLPAEPAHG